MHPVLVWFREDLRLTDNPAFYAALKTGQPVLCFYIFETSSAIERLGSASKWWLHGSLENLSQQLKRLNITLALFSGEAEQLVPHIVEMLNAKGLFWNRRYGKAETELDTKIKTACHATQVESFNGRLLHEPWEVKTKTGGAFTVFSPYWKTALAKGAPDQPLPAPSEIKTVEWPDALSRSRVALKSQHLEPSHPNWAKEFDVWHRGEQGAHQQLDCFLEQSLEGYSDNRNRPDQDSTSRLSPHLRFGEISPRHIWHKGEVLLTGNDKNRNDFDKLLSEIGWRDFSYNLLFYKPDLKNTPLQKRFEHFPYRENENDLRAWQHGRTGYPIVDAGLRQLWRTGWMHNRVRMIVASFLIKHLLIDWREGEKWFWDTLVDADPASNPASWQWVAGCGADAAPYFRIFNPVLQGEKFDPDGLYVKKWLPELSALPSAFIHKPWKASILSLKDAKIVLGKTYPAPIVDHDFARKRALEALAKI